MYDRIVAGAKSVIEMSWPENEGILFFIYFSNTANELDIFHGCSS